MELIHKHMLGKAIVKKPPMTAKKGRKWLKNLVELIDMKILIPADAVECNTFGNEGVTGIVCLETSHASFHSWSELDEPFINFDIYSCKEFDPQVVLDHLAQFDVVKVNYILIDRTSNTIL